MNVYRIRYKPNGKYVGSGLSQEGPAKIWLKLSSARNAISQSTEVNISDDRSPATMKRKNYEIVECELTEVGVVQ